MGCHIVGVDMAGHASARPGVDIHGDSASDSSVVDDMLRRAAAVAGESEGSGMDISRRAAAWSRDVPSGPLASAASCDGDGGCDSRTGELGIDAQRGVGGSETREVRIDDVSLKNAQDPPADDGSGVR